MNNQILAQTTNQVTMSSHEIVEFINDFRCEYAEKPTLIRHSDFMAKVSKVLGFLTSEKFRSSYIGGNGESRPCYVFPKREACLMAMSYSYELQAQIFDRMTAMEEALKAPKPTALSRMELIQLALEAEQENQALRGQISVLEPKAHALDALADSSNTYTIREVAKTLGVKEKHLVELLLNKRWLYRENSKHRRLCAYAQAIEKKVMVNKVTKLVSACDGDKAYTQARITAFGLTRLTAIVEKAGIAA